MSRTNRLRLWLVDRQASNLLRRVNRPYEPSVHIGGTPRTPDSPLTITALAFAVMAVCLVLVINVLVMN